MAKLALRMVKRWVAGETAQDALKSAEKANASGMKAIINFLGEHTTNTDAIQHAFDQYMWLQQKFSELKLDACISVKPTQLGLLRNVKVCNEYMRRLAEQAEELKGFVWIDMESSEFTEATLNIHNSLRKRFPNIGIALQANLKRSEHDLENLIHQDAIIRLVKGAYRENPRNAYTRKKDVTENFRKLMRRLFETKNQFAVATHDPRIIWEVAGLSKQGNHDVEFQMLMGVMNRLKTELIKRGLNIVVYIPYGEDWLPYTLRRLRERKQNILLLIEPLIPHHSQ